MFDKEIAIVILNFNGSLHLKTFLPSVIQHSHSATIYVIDNGSTDDSIQVIENEFPTILLIRNEKNFGFAGGYNEGLAQIKEAFPFFVLLNSDVEVTANWLTPLHETMKKELSCIAVQPKILSYSDKNSFEHAGAAGGYIDKHYFPFCRGRIFDTIEKDNSQYNSPKEVAWTSGAAMMVRAQEFLEIGGFDADFFAHMEEIDWCLRAKAYGYTLSFCPESSVFHLGGGTLPYQSSFKVYLNFRNNLTMIIKNHQGLLFPLLYTRMSLDGIAAFKFLLSGKPSLLWAVFKAHMYTYKNLSRNLHKRKAIQHRKKQSLLLFKGSILWNYFILKNRTYYKLNKRRFKL